VTAYVEVRVECEGCGTMTGPFGRVEFDEANHVIAGVRRTRMVVISDGYDGAIDLCRYCGTNPDAALAAAARHRRDNAARVAKEQARAARRAQRKELVT